VGDLSVSPHLSVFGRCRTGNAWYRWLGAAPPAARSSASPPLLPRAPLASALVPVLRGDRPPTAQRFIMWRREKGAKAEARYVFGVWGGGGCRVRMGPTKSCHFGHARAQALEDSWGHDPLAKDFFKLIGQRSQDGGHLGKSVECLRELQLKYSSPIQVHGLGQLHIFHRVELSNSAAGRKHLRFSFLFRSQDNGNWSIQIKFTGFLPINFLLLLAPVTVDTHDLC